MNDGTQGRVEDLRERTRRRMAELGIPKGTEDPALAALGAPPLVESARTTFVRAGVVLRSDMTEQEAAIAIVEDSRETHVQWRDWLAKHPNDPAVAAGIGDLTWHTECVENYDRVLAVLRDRLNAKEAA